MISKLQAQYLSAFECENRPLSELMSNIEKYIVSLANNKETVLLYMVDGYKYNKDTTKKAIKLLKKAKYKVIVRKCKKQKINMLDMVELKIMWWY